MVFYCIWFSLSKIFPLYERNIIWDLCVSENRTVFYCLLMILLWIFLLFSLVFRRRSSLIPSAVALVRNKKEKKRA